MRNKTYLASIKKRALTYSEKRREVIKEAGDALHLSKRAIFAMHRDDMKEAKQKLAGAEKILKQMARTFSKTPGLLLEGSHRDSLEEYVEASLLYSFLKTKKFPEIKAVSIPPEVYVAGLCDVPGELHRYAVKAATERDHKTVNLCKEAAQEIVGVLIEFNLTRYLRNKFDQAKQAARKIEHVVYELSLRD